MEKIEAEAYCFSLSTDEYAGLLSEVTNYFKDEVLFEKNEQPKCIISFDEIIHMDGLKEIRFRIIPDKFIKEKHPSPRYFYFRFFKG